MAPELAAELPGSDGEHEAVPINNLAYPPTEGVDAAIEWAAGVMAQTAVHARSGSDPARVRALQAAAKTLGSLRQAASDASDTLAVAAAYNGVQVDCSSEEPPTDPAGVCVWAFWQTIRLMWETATTPEAVDEAQVRHVAKTYETLRQVHPQSAIDRHADAAQTKRGAFLRAV